MAGLRWQATLAGMLLRGAGRMRDCALSSLPGLPLRVRLGPRALVPTLSSRKGPGLWEEWLTTETAGA